MMDRPTHARVSGSTRPVAWPRTGLTRPHIAAIALIGVVYSAILLLNIVALLGTPRLSVFLSVPASGQAHVAWLLPGSMLWDDSVRAGTPVLALDRRRPAPRDTGRWTGDQLGVRLATGAPMTISSASIRGGRVTWPLLVLSPCFLLLGTLILLRAPRADVGRATYALCAVAAFALALAPSTIGDEPLATAVEFAAVTLFAAYFVVFCLTFPVRRGAARLRVLVVVPPLITIALYLAALIMLPDLYAVAANLRLAILLVYLLLGASLLIHSFVTVRDRAARRGLLIISAGATASVLPFLTLYLAPTLLRRPTVLAPEQAILALALLPLSLTYAILRHHALDMHLLQRWLVYGLLGGGLVVVYAAVVFAWNLYLGNLPEPTSSLVFSAVLGTLAVILFGPLYGRARRGLDRLIFKDRYEYRAALQGISRDLTAMSDVDAVGAALPQSIRRLMNLDFAVLLVCNGQEQESAVGGNAGADDPALLAALVTAAQENGDGAEPRVVPLGYGYLKVALIPLRTHDALVGHLCLGPKISGEPYGADDRALLATLSSHLAAIVRNIQLVADLRATIRDLHAQRQAVEFLNARLERTREEERARLAADLHDEPLQTALDIQRRLAAAHTQFPAAAMYGARLQTLIDQLRALCIRMRPAALDQLGLHAALDLLAMDVGERSDVLIGLSPSTELDGAALSPAAELVLYRAAQEALTNSVRHGRAREVMITLQRHDDTVRLCIADDGIGFTFPANLDDLVLSGHLGLAGLHQRVRYSGGQLVLRSTPGRGTTVQVDLPLERRDREEARA